MAIILAHIYIGTLGMEGAYDAMGSGDVEEQWAREHHSLWVEEVLGETTNVSEPLKAPAVKAAKAPVAKTAKGTSAKAAKAPATKTAKSTSAKAAKAPVAKTVKATAAKPKKAPPKK